ncbi:MAG: hypothetical protein Q8S00_00565 [Deltaproteobacteria bacterium]|nr:hypothetical protein [Deltaproteobacteria bacterium]
MLGSAFFWLNLLVPLPVIGAFQQPHRIRYHLQPLVERLVLAAQRLRRRNVHDFDCAGFNRAKNQRALRHTGAGVGN